MEGLIEIKHPYTQNAVDTALDTLRTLRKMPKYYRGLLGVQSYNMGYLKKTIRGLRRCVELAKEFKQVKRDDDVKRAIKHANFGYEVVLEVPLVFAAKLPLPRVHSHVVIQGSSRYEVKTQVPAPPTEAVQALSKHAKKFDGVELWWVPTQILVKEIPDPILVGRIDLGVGCVWYEIYRWIDETVETAYWAKEAY